jgi:hypothetical protein
VDVVIVTVTLPLCSPPNVRKLVAATGTVATTSTVPWNGAVKPGKPSRRNLANCAPGGRGTLNVVITVPVELRSVRVRIELSVLLGFTRATAVSKPLVPLNSTGIKKCVANGEEACPASATNVPEALKKSYKTNPATVPADVTRAQPPVAAALVPAVLTVTCEPGGIVTVTDVAGDGVWVSKANEIGVPEPSKNSIVAVTEPVVGLTRMNVVL